MENFNEAFDRTVANTAAAENLPMETHLTILTLEDIGEFVEKHLITPQDCSCGSGMEVGFCPNCN